MFEEMSDNKCLPYCSAEMKIKERMVYLFYELHRKSSHDDYCKLSMELGELLIFIKKNILDFPGVKRVDPQSGSERFLDSTSRIFEENPMSNDKRIHYLEYLLYLFKMIVQTRDIYEGKGERDVTYMLIYTWYKHYPVLTVNVLPFVIHYGCWRDICGICNYIYAISGDDSHPLIETCVEIMILQLEKDENSAGTGTGVSFIVGFPLQSLEILVRGPKGCEGLKGPLPKGSSTEQPKVAKGNESRFCFAPLACGSTKPSLAAKWVPREKPQTQWLYDIFVLKWSNKKWPYILHTSKYSCVAYGMAWNKCRMKFRKMISNLTKKIDIVETKQCSQQWAKIRPCDVNIGTFISQKDCLLNNRNDKERTLENCDRLQCSQNMQKLYKNGFPKSHRNNNNNKSLLSIPIGYFVKRAIELLASQENHEKNKIDNIYGPDSSGSHSESKYIEKEMDLLNIQWKKYTKLRACVNLPNIIPIIDVSTHCSDKELYNAIGLTCLITEKSLIAKRVVITHHENMWINLENCDDFISMVRVIYNQHRIFSENPRCRIEKTHRSAELTYTFYSNNYKFDDRHNLFNLTNSINKIIESIQHSNMTNENIQQMIFVIFQSSASNHNNVSKLFSSSQPHFVYWNLSESVSDVIEYPCEGFVRGTTMISGNSHALVNYLQFLCLASFRQSTQYNAMCNILDNNRYDAIEKLFMETIG